MRARRTNVKQERLRVFLNFHRDLHCYRFEITSFGEISETHVWTIRVRLFFAVGAIT
jgi:hypothetical protein